MPCQWPIKQRSLDSIYNRLTIIFRWRVISGGMTVNRMSFLLFSTHNKCIQILELWERRENHNQLANCCLLDYHFNLPDLYQAQLAAAVIDTEIQHPLEMLSAAFEATSLTLRLALNCPFPPHLRVAYASEPHRYW